MKHEITIKDIQDLDRAAAEFLEKIGNNTLVAFFAPMGSGKTTFIKLLCRLYDPQEGQILLNGIDIRKYRYDDYMNIFSVVFQDFQLLMDRSVEDNLRFVLEATGWKDKEKIAARITEVLDAVGMGRKAHKMPFQLSGGEQQRVAIARALINNPSVLFADEPSGNLDSKTKEELHKLFFTLRDKYGQTIIIVTHDPDLAKMCDRSLYMVDGQFVSQ